MKKIFFSFLAFLLICTTAFGASFQIEDNPNYKHPSLSLNSNGNATAYYDTSKPVSYDAKSTSNSYFWAFNSSWYSPKYKFSWAEGASGSDGDYAISLTATSDAVLSEGHLYLYYVGDNAFKNRGGSFFTEFDLKLSTTTDRFMIYDLPIWGSGNYRTLFNENGKIAGTDVPYSANTWMHVKLELNYETSKCNMWVDNTKVVDNVSMVSGTYNKSSRIDVYLKQQTAKSSGEQRASFALDNFIAYVVGKDISSYVTMDITDSDGTPAISSQSPVNPKIKLTFPNAFNVSLLNNENIVLTNASGNEVPCDINVDSSAFTATLIPKRTLSFEETYSVKLSDEIRKGCKSTNPATGKLKFTTANERDVVISGFSLSSQDAGNSASAIATLTNNTGSSKQSGLMLAVYNKDGGLCAIKRVNLTLSAGANSLTNELSLTLPADFDAMCKVKLFVTPADDYNIIHEAALN